jgi:Uma2 family endonuclease
VRLAVTLSDSEPEPDFALVRGTGEDYEHRHPGPPEIGLIIEVADSSLLRDRHDKARIYARGGIGCYWIVNLVDRRIEVHTQPSGPTAAPAYGTSQTYQPGDKLPLILDGTTVGTLAVTDLIR